MAFAIFVLKLLLRGRLAHFSTVYLSAGIVASLTQIQYIVEKNCSMFSSLKLHCSFRYFVIQIDLKSFQIVLNIQRVLLTLPHATVLVYKFVLRQLRKPYEKQPLPYQIPTHFKQSFPGLTQSSIQQTASLHFMWSSYRTRSHVLKKF